MMVTREPVDHRTLIALVSQQDDDAAGIHSGEVLIYMCTECENADETAMQVVHDEECSAHGDHLCEDLPELETGTHTKTAELDPDHPITIVRMGETDHGDGVYQGEPIAFRCDECGNADETLSEIVHDELCSLAGEHGREVLRGETATAD